MIRFIKPARGKNIHQRGYFSFITEGVIHIYNAMLNYPTEEFKVYFDLFDINGYGSMNIYDVCFIQDIEDYNINFLQYKNIENLPLQISLDPYDETTFTKEKLKNCESIIKNYFKLNGEMKHLFSSRHSQIDFSSTIGFHRRATDMVAVHNVTTIPLESIFEILEKEEFENVFLMSDNLTDLNRFKKRYGNKLITFDEFSTSEFNDNPFFKTNKDEELIKKHIQEIVFGAYTLGMTKKLFCTKSNLSTFSILSNSQLNYKRLN